MEDHRVIERGLAILEAACDKVEAGEEVPVAVFRQMIDFIRTFADRCHHGKEEDILFTSMEQAGMPRQAGPLGVMLTEHEEGRGYVRGMDEATTRVEAGETAAWAEVVRNARAYAALLRQHIFKEDNVLYPLAHQVLPAERMAEMLDEFEQAEKERVGAGVHQRYHALLEELERQVGISR